MDATRGKTAFDLDKQVKNNERARRELLAKNAEILSTIYENNYFKELLGFEDGEWAGYLADLEVYYSRNQIDSYVRVCRKLRSLGMSTHDWVDAPITRLVDTLTILTKENVDEWLIKAKTLTAKDFAIELRTAKGLLTEDDEHQHDMVEYSICRKCGLKHKTATLVK